MTLTTRETELLNHLDEGGSTNGVHSLYPTARPLPTLYWIRGALRQEAGDFDLAAEDFRRAAEFLGSGNEYSRSSNRGWLIAKSLGRLGECLHARGRFADARSAFSKASQELEAWLGEQTKGDRGEYRASLAWLYGMTSECWRECGDARQALLAADSAVRLDPGHPGWRVTRGLALQALTEHRRALADFRKAIRLNPKLAAVHAYCASSLSVLGRLKERLEAAREYVNRRANEPVAWFDFVDAVRALGDKAAAKRAIKAFLQRFPGEVRGVLLRADKIEKSDPEMAMAFVDGVLAQLPCDPEALRRRGMLRLYDFEDYRRALADFRKAVGVLGNDDRRIRAMRLRYLIGETLWSLDRYGDAISAYEKALPGEDDELFVAEIHLRIAECSEKTKNHSRLLHHLREFWKRHELITEDLRDEERYLWAKRMMSLNLDESASADRNRT